MSGKALWNRVLEVLSISGEEIQTTTGLWVKASLIDGRVYIDKAVNHLPSSKLSMQRPITKKDFLLVHSYYDRWVNGEVGVRHEVQHKLRVSI